MLALRKWALSVVSYCVFSSIPKNWSDREQVKLFLRSNTGMLVWLVQLTETKIDDKFADLYSQVVNNDVLFDVFYDFAAKIWSNPSELTDQTQFTDVKPFIDDTRVRNGLFARLKQRRVMSGLMVDAVEEEAAQPGSILAIVTVVSAIANIAALILKIRNFRNM